MAIALGTVDSKVTGTCAVTPVADAAMIAGPALVEETVTLALPDASVTAVGALSVPRVDANETVWPTTGAPAEVQWTVTPRAVLSGVRAFAAGDVNVKL